MFLQIASSQKSCQSILLFSVFIAGNLANLQAAYSAEGDLDFGSGTSTWKITDDKTPRQVVPTSRPQVKNQHWRPLPAEARPGAFSGSKPEASSAFTVNASFDTGKIRESGQDNPAGIALEKEGLEAVDKGDYSRAFAAFKQAAKLNAHRAAYWYNMGLSAAHLSLWNDAREAFGNSTNIDKNFDKAWIELARIEIIQGNKERALTILNNLKWKVGASQKIDRNIEGWLVMLGDERACQTPSMLASAKDSELTAGASNLFGTKPALALLLTKELERRKPFDAKVQCSLGKCYFKTGKYSEALSCFKKAEQVSQSDPDTLLLIINACIELGQLEDILHWKQEFVTRFPDNPNAKRFESELAYYNKDFSRTRQRESAQQSQSGSGDSPAFSRNDMPLRVYAPDWSRVTGDWKQAPDPNVDYMGLLHKVCDDWSAASGSRVSFLLVTTVDDANIAITWVDDQSSLSHSFAAGSTTREVNSVGKRRARITILVPTQKKTTNSRYFYETCLHEFGHALGLSHSSEPGDIMYFSVHGIENRSLSENDQRRISEMYR